MSILPNHTKLRILLASVLTYYLVLAICAIPELRYVNQGKSTVLGSVRSGSLQNSWLVPFRGKNYRYFSALSYYGANNGYTSDAVCKTILDAYQACEQSCPGIRFQLMECSDRYGGRVAVHRTHQNGTSADFMIPKKRGNAQSELLDHLGFLHYLLDFDQTGKNTIFSSVSLDFGTAAQHLIALDDAANAHGLRIKKVLLRTECHDAFFSTLAGKELKRRNVRFVTQMEGFVNRVHDDHYHVDFEVK
jgi:penicillin-insensitive murein DD-endopeptidase